MRHAQFIEATSFTHEQLLALSQCVLSADEQAGHQEP